MSLSMGGVQTVRMVLQEPVYTQDSFGQATITWTDRFTRWAKIQPITGAGRERYTEQVVVGEQPIIVKVRYDKTLGKQIKPDWRWKRTIAGIPVEEGEPVPIVQYYNIRNIVNIRNENFEIEMVCVEEIR